MRSCFSDRRSQAALATLFFVPAASLWAQKSAGPASTPAPTANAGVGNVGTNGSISNNGRNNTANFPNSTNNPTGSQQQTSPIFLSGRVMFDDGTQPDRDIRIERICGGAVRVEGHTDSKGHFSFQVGQNASFDMDASDGSFGQRPGSSMNNNNGGFGNNGNSGGYGGIGGSNSLMGCELRASYPGYRSDYVELGNRRALDNPDVGTLVMHHLGNVQGTTISLTTALAPKDARKEYEKGVQLAEKGKFDDAMRRFASATELYPKYAVAWYALGQLQQKQGHAAEARTSYEKASSADTHYVSPLNQMALLSAQEGKWEEAANYSKQAISLNPVEFPSAFWYNALANYNLKKSTDAEKSTKDLLKLDTQHHYPEAENLMAQLLLDSGNYPEAATHLRSYLTLVPNAKNADTLKQMLLKIEAAKSSAPPAPLVPGSKP